MLNTPAAKRAHHDGPHDADAADRSGSDSDGDVAHMDIDADGTDLAQLGGGDDEIVFMKVIMQNLGGRPTSRSWSQVD